MPHVIRVHTIHVLLSHCSDRSQNNNAIYIPQRYILTHSIGRQLFTHSLLRMRIIIFDFSNRPAAIVSLVIDHTHLYGLIVWIL